jgi:hypothetical protein
MMNWRLSILNMLSKQAGIKTQQTLIHLHWDLVGTLGWRNTAGVKV